MDITVTTPATQTSISVDLVKQSQRVLHDLENDLIEFWIKAADDYIADRINGSMMKRTLMLRVSRVLTSIELPYPPVISVTSMKYTPTGGSEVIVDQNTGVIITNPNMLPAYAINGLTSATDGTMTVIYDAGYDDPAKVPPKLRQASLLMASHFLNSREATYLDPRAIKVERKIEFGVDQMVALHRIPNVNDFINGGY